ncbi:MAG: cation-translocating P-type ATPase [Anaerolineae bacterium]|nr:cation-translocating P-type ATPase [Anaerolineae bacterium]
MDHKGHSMAVRPVDHVDTPQPASEQIWYTLDRDTTFQHLTSNQQTGLTPAEAAHRLQQVGPNELTDKPLKSPLIIFREQMMNPLVLLLVFAAGLSALLGKVDSVVAIMAIVVLNAALGVFQEYRAEQAMAALKQMAAPLVRVRRGGQVTDVAARELVPGDVVLLEAGSIIPADGRVIEAANLSVQEASLTGESLPVQKSMDALAKADTPLGDRRNMVHMGTSVTFGRGEAVIVKTGMQTELGRIAELIQTVEDEVTPLQRRMAEVGKVLVVAALVVLAIAVIIGLIAGQTLDDVLLNAVAIAVAVVPEGLPAVVTIALALGAQRMLRRNALIRKLPAVETLGSVTTICSDKTGTLTQNRMTVRVVDVAGEAIDLDELVGRGIDGLIRANGSAPAPHKAQALVLAGATLCSDVVVEHDPDGGLRLLGDPTEGALVAATERFGIERAPLEAVLPRVGEAPFSSERKRMSTVHTLNRQTSAGPRERYLVDLLDAERQPYVVLTKGSVDGLLDISLSVWMDGIEVPLTPDLRARIEEANNHLAESGLRVLGMGFRYLTDRPQNWEPETLEQDLTFVGLVGMIDPPRPEVKSAVEVCRTAGIRPVMITGDHPLTAFNIARELHIAEAGSRVLTGRDLNRMSLDELEAVVEDVAVYARVSPEHKLNIVQALQKRGHIVAMTGDGVNDAPALKRSNIGVAMGITGTDVSKEAADMVLVDDNFTTIVSAVEQGRTIFDNVRRFIKYLLASNTGELIVLLITDLIAGMSLPLTTLQILWMNLITDGIPALALGVERSEKGSMKRAPYAPDESMFGRGLGRHVLLIGLTLGVTGLAFGYWAWSNELAAANGKPAWNTMVFMFLMLAQMGHALSLRSHRESLFALPFFGNRLLLGAVVGTVILQFIAVYTPFFNQLFNTNPLTLEQLALCLGLGTIIFWVSEGEKLLIRRGVLR